MKGKRFISGLLTIIMLAGLCACSSKSETDGESVKRDTDEEITLQFWEMNYGSDDSYLETCEKLVSQYEEENPGVNIEITLITISFS